MVTCSFAGASTELETSAKARMVELCPSEVLKPCRQRVLGPIRRHLWQPFCEHISHQLVAETYEPPFDSYVIVCYNLAVLRFVLHQEGAGYSEQDLGLLR